MALSPVAIVNEKWVNGKLAYKEFTKLFTDSKTQLLNPIQRAKVELAETHDVFVKSITNQTQDEIEDVHYSEHPESPLPKFVSHPFGRDAAYVTKITYVTVRSDGRIVEHL